ncbi:hypothetical protein TNCV_1077541 [Trichonephila clavipes]|uniref:Uncharacterized protein n=1 Tax=Trichonephila clavipes TaxID=2585209 RepID=A0A8X6V7J8_TRICX|nr:hypothetical protein TNCV_1077541 [Trichonephila clavipes]
MFKKHNAYATSIPPVKSDFRYSECMYARKPSDQFILIAFPSYPRHARLERDLAIWMANEVLESRIGTLPSPDTPSMIVKTQMKASLNTIRSQPAGFQPDRFKHPCNLAQQCAGVSGGRYERKLRSISRLGMDTHVRV